MASPSYNYNTMTRTIGYPWVDTGWTDTGDTTIALQDLGRNLSNGVKLTVGAAGGRLFETWNSEITCLAGQWISMLVEVLDVDMGINTGGAGGNSPIRLSTAGEAAGTTSVSIDAIKLGGPGWYCVTGQWAATTAVAIKVGLGIASNETSSTITFGRIGAFQTGKTEMVPDFALPSYPAAYATTGNTVDATTRRVTWGSTAIPNMRTRNTVFYAIGDSKSNSDQVEAPWPLASRHNKPVYVYSMSGFGFDAAITNQAHIAALKVNSQQQTNRDIWADMDEFPKSPIRPNCLMYSNFGVNDSNANYTAAEEINNFVTFAATLGYDDACITEITGWGDGGSNATGDQMIIDFNALALTTCAVKNWIFTRLYYALNKKLDNGGDTTFLSDGADGDIDYSNDGLHLIVAGSDVVSSLINGSIEQWHQRNP